VNYIDRAGPVTVDSELTLGSEASTPHMRTSNLK
jgi:hypothetical protein